MQEAPILIETLPDGTSFELLLVEGGSFLMGSEEEEAYSDEQPVHEVRLQSFYAGKYPVTQGLWKAVMGVENNPSFFQGAARPVEQVSWNDTEDFLRRLQQLTGKPYRLLSEAEWEYAARGGCYGRGCKYAGSNKLSEVGWYTDNSHGETKPVGLKRANELGLYDMSGNVWEWVADQWHDNYNGAPTNGSSWIDREEGSSRVFRGGSWRDTSRYCRAAIRDDNLPAYRRRRRRLSVGFVPPVSWLAHSGPSRELKGALRSAPAKRRGGKR